MPGRTIAIGDIHGCDVALDVLLVELALTPEDKLVVLGDIVDRGPNTRACIEMLLHIREHCQLVTILGNHEEMLFDALEGGPWARSWLQYGGREMLDSYNGTADQIPEEHLDFLAAALEFHETDTEIFTHATISSELPPGDQHSEYWRWNRLTGREMPHVSGRRVICGHTAQRSSYPVVFPGWVCIDTYSYGPGGALTALDCGANLVYQSTQAGDFREVVPLAEFE